MRLTKEQQFLSSRIATLLCAALATVFLYAGVQGFVYWYDGFAPALFLSLALLNYPLHSSLWRAVNRPRRFALFYLVIIFAALLLDGFGSQLHLWFYPFYHDAGRFVLYLFIVPVSTLLLIEILYFLSVPLREPFEFPRHPLPLKRFGIFLFFGTVVFLLASTLLPALHLREWVSLGSSFSSLCTTALLGTPVFKWVWSLCSALTVLSLWVAMVLHDTKDIK